MNRYIVYSPGPGGGDAGFNYSTSIKNAVFQSAEGAYNAMSSFYGAVPVFVIDSQTGDWGRYFENVWTGDLRP